MVLNTAAIDAFRADGRGIMTGHGPASEMVGLRGRAPVGKLDEPAAARPVPGSRDSQRLTAGLQKLGPPTATVSPRSTSPHHVGSPNCGLVPADPGRRAHPVRLDRSVDACGQWMRAWTPGRGGRRRKRRSRKASEGKSGYCPGRSGCSPTGDHQPAHADGAPLTTPVSPTQHHGEWMMQPRRSGRSPGCTGRPWLAAARTSTATRARPGASTPSRGVHGGQTPHRPMDGIALRQLQ